MNLARESLKGTTCETLVLAKWHNERTPQDGPPDEMEVFFDACFEKNGDPVTDPARLEEIKTAQLKQVRIAHGLEEP